LEIREAIGRQSTNEQYRLMRGHDHSIEPLELDIILLRKHFPNYSWKIDFVADA
jgi:hypothetical protein